MLKSLEGKLTAEEKEFVKAVRKALDVAEKAKIATDTLMYGVPNVEGGGKYFPLATSSDEIYTAVGVSNDILQTIKRFGFNIDTVPNAKTKLVIENVFEVLARHIDGMSIYHGYAVPITTYNRVMNKRIDGKNLHNEIAKINPGFKEYMNNLLLNIQGINKTQGGWGSATIARLRLGLALAALNLNPKVLLTQTVSLASALSELDAKYVMKGMPGFTSKQAMADIVKHSPLMAERNDIAGNIDVQEVRQRASKLGKAGKIITAPMKGITWTDSHIIATIYQAALNEQADVHGYKIDSEENKIAAARRTEEIVFKSQQTSDALGRSEFMRNKNELMRMFSMFKGDAMQLTSQFVSSVDRVLTYKKYAASGNPGLVKIANDNTAAAKKAFAKSGTAVFMNATWIAVLGLAFKAWKGFKDDEDAKDVIIDEVLGNLAGMIPLGSEFYSLLQGFDLDNPAYSAMTTLVNTAKSITEGAGALMSGDAIDDVQARATARRTALGFSQMLGLPLRNIESYGMGTIGHISPSTKAQYDALFKTKSNKAYMEAITKAVEKR